MGDTRTKIVETARDILLDEGLRALSMREVAKRVGISATAIYRHYKDKDELLASAVAEGADVLRRYFEKVLAKSQSPRERLLLTGRAYLSYAFEHPRYYQLMFMAWDDLAFKEPRGRSQVGGALQFLFDRIEECKRVGVFDAHDDVLELAMACWSTVHGLASLYLAGGGKQRMTLRQYRRLSETVMNRIVTGLMLPQRRARAGARRAAAVDAAPRQRDRRPSAASRRTAGRRCP